MLVCVRLDPCGRAVAMAVHRELPNPALHMMASWTGPDLLPSTHFGVGYASVPPLQLCFRGDRVPIPVLQGSHRAGIGPLPVELFKMSHDLVLAQNHAFQLARTLMVPVTLFKSGDAYGVLPSDELDVEDDLDVIHEFDPHGFRPAH